MKREPWLMNSIMVGAVMIFLSGCAVVTTQPTVLQAPGKQGVSYYLPKKDVIVTLTIGDAAPMFSVAETAAYPDIENRFLARYHQSWIGADTLKIGVNSKGLLNSTTTAKFESKLPEIMTNIAKDVAMLARKAEATPEPETKGCNKCSKKGSYSELIELSKNDTGIWEKESHCGYKITVKRLGVSNVKNKGLEEVFKEDPDARCRMGYPGFFYRQHEPYLVIINENGGCSDLPTHTAIVYSPNNAPLELLPIERGLFANANIEFEFEDGSLKSYQQTKDSEIAAITKLPADIASAYFKAVGDMFTVRSQAVNNEASYQKAVAGLLLQQQKTNACMAAIAAKDQKAIDENCK
jgi:hypothetical protein